MCFAFGFRNFQWCKDNLFRIWPDRVWKNIHYDGYNRWLGQWNVHACVV